MKIKYGACILMVLFLASMVQPIVATPEIETELILSAHPNKNFVFEPTDDIKLQAKLKKNKPVLDRLCCRYVNFDVYKITASGDRGSLVFHERKRTNLSGIATSHKFKLDRGRYLVVASYRRNKVDSFQCSVSRTLYVGSNPK